MTKLQALSIQNFRGILKLDLDLSGKTFAIHGPNGCGKSGVVDAIDFALTGGISRLSGQGTAGLSAGRHGPHVDFKPSDSKVKLSVLFEDGSTTATIERSLGRPKNPRISPDQPDIRSRFADLEKHPEFVLSRREIIKYILIEPGKRAEQIQSLLKLGHLQQFRAALKTASNTFTREKAQAQTARATADTALRTVLSLEQLTDEYLLAEVNRLRAIAGAEALADLCPATRLDVGMLPAEPSSPQSVSKKAVGADLTTFRGLYAGEVHQLAQTAIQNFEEKRAELQADSSLLSDLEKNEFFEFGLSSFDGRACPLCDVPWEDLAFRQLLKDKLARLARGKKARDDLLGLAAPVVERFHALQRPMMALEAAAKALDSEGAASLADALVGIASVIVKLATANEALALSLGELALATVIGPEVTAALLKLEEASSRLPEESANSGAKALLIQAQTRFKDARDAVPAFENAHKLAERAAQALDLYDRVMEAALNGLYEEVKNDFVKFYRLLHGDDEAAFEAELKREAAGVELAVDFYGRSLVPPAAYHSEGHQDSMGLCLYLALMKRARGPAFSFAVLDDVVMSVDTGHRRALCRLLNDHFQKTQFILTTHDKVWLGQLHASGVVKRRDALHFTNWSVDRGPTLREPREVWDDIAAKLSLDDVNAAAGALRRYLEEMSFDLADQLRSPVPLRADSSYMLSDLLPGITTRWKELLGKAISAAQSWGDSELQAALLERKAAYQAVLNASNVEQWALNPVVHYNQWENFSREDFSPVVLAFKELLKFFRCPKCDLWLYAEPAIPSPETIRCPCGGGMLNLAPKPKEPS